MEKLVAGAERLGIALSARQIEQFQAFYKELAAWNERVNLTSVIDYQDVQLKHFLDSLTAAAALDGSVFVGGARILDLGTGAGLPGIPLKIAFPHIGLVLLESTRKKTVFLEHLLPALQLEARVVTGRAEEVAHLEEFRESFDVVLSRAVGKLPEMVELALPFCRVGGIFIAYKKGDIEDEIARGKAAMAELGGRLEAIRPVDVPGLDEEGGRFLVIVAKDKATPERYPRRSGVPGHRPLG